MNASNRNEFRASARAVALGKLSAFDGECWRLAGLARIGIIDRIDAIDALHEIAIAHSLYGLCGVAAVQSMLAEAFGTYLVKHKVAA